MWWTTEEIDGPTKISTESRGLFSIVDLSYQRESSLILEYKEINCLETIC